MGTGSGQEHETSPLTSEEKRARYRERQDDPEPQRQHPPAEERALRRLPLDVPGVR